jgi:hypothetical protein
LGFSKTNTHFEEREFGRKWANGHAELLFWKKCRIIQINSVIGLFELPILQFFVFLQNIKEPLYS